MKNQLRKLVFVVACLGLILSGCEKDLYEDAVIQKNQNFKIESKSFKEISKDINFKQPLDKVLRNTTNNDVANKTVLEELYNFTIMEETPVKILTNGNAVSYILCIKRTIKEELVFENLILKQEEGLLRAFITKYTLNEKPIINLADDSFNLNINKTELNELFFGGGQTANHDGPTGSRCYEHWTLTFQLCVNDGGGNIGEVHFANENCTNSDFLSTVTYSGVNIVSTAPSGNGPASSGEEGGDQSGGGSDGSNYNPPVDVVPVIPINYSFSDVFQALDPDAQSYIINFIVDNPSQENTVRVSLDNINFSSLSNMSPQVQSGVTAYLAANNVSPAAQTVANQFIASPTSPSPVVPFIIEEYINVEELDECTKAIFNKIKGLQQNDIANIIKRFENPQNLFNVTMQQTEILPQQLPNNQYYITIANTKPIQTNNEYFSYQIKLNTTFFNDTKMTRLMKANTIMHEMIHALINSVVDHHNINPNSTNGMEFESVWNEFINIKYGAVANENQHIFMMNKYVNILSAALQEYDTGVPAIMANQVDTLYKDIAWAGLARLPYFQTISTLTVEDRVRITQRIDVEIDNETQNDVVPSSPPCN